MELMKTISDKNNVYRKAKHLACEISNPSPHLENSTSTIQRNPSEHTACCKITKITHNNVVIVILKHLGRT